MKYTKKIILVLIYSQLCCMSVLPIARAAKPKPSLNVGVEHGKIIENQPFRLLVELKNKKFRGSSPDFSVLQNNFMVIKTSQVSSSSWINGKKSSSITWQFILRAKPDKINKITNSKSAKVGEIKIPKLYVANLSHKEFMVDIVAAGDNNFVDERPSLALMQTSVNNLSPVVQGMVHLKIRMRLARNFQKGTLSEFIVKDAIVLPLGQDKDYPENKNGIKSHIYERNYAIFPQKSGKLTLVMPIFDGVFGNSNGGFRDFDDFFKINISSVPVRETAKDIILNVKEALQTEGLQYWLPADGLSINQEWEANKKIKQGEPIVRKITVRTTNLTAEQIPNLVDYEIDGASHYTDTPTLENTTDNLKVLGKRIDTVTYIPTNDGDLIFPEVKVKWWDNKNKLFKTIKVPGKKFTVLPAVKPKAEEPSVIPAMQQPQLPLQQQVAKMNPWMYLAIVLIILWISTIMFWLYLRRKPTKVTNSKTLPAKDMTVKQLYKEIENSCKANLANDTLKYIFRLSEKKIGRPVNSLTDIEQCITKETILAMQELERVIYKDNVKDWDGDVLWRLIQEESFTQIVNDTKDDALPPLNPE